MQKIYFYLEDVKSKHEGKMKNKIPPRRSFK